MTVFGVRSATTLPIRLRRRVRFVGSATFVVVVVAFARVARTRAAAVARARGAAFAAVVRERAVVRGALFLAGTFRLRRHGALLLKRQDASDLLARAADR